MSDEWDFEAIKVPAGCWVHSTSGDLMLPGGKVVGKLSPQGLRALEWYLEDDLALASSMDDPNPSYQSLVEEPLEE